MRSLIVALLCLTLFVDTAKACWLRRHRGRSNTCRPVACCPPVPTDCPLDSHVSSSDPHAVTTSPPLIVGGSDAFLSDCGCGRQTVGAQDLSPNALDTDVARVEESTAAGAGQAMGSTAAETPVVHGPTMLIDAPQAAVAPAAPAAPAPGPASVLVPAPSLPLPATAGPTLPAAAAREPLPDLKPAVAPASNEQPLADAPAPAPLQLPEATPPMPAPAESLAGGPEMKTAAPAPPAEPNLFDLFDAEEAEEGVTPGPMEPSNAAEEAAPREPGSPAADPVMTDKEDAAEPAAAPAEIPAAEPAAPAPATPADEQPAEEPQDAPAAAPAAETAAAASRTVPPHEPLRRWSDVTGGHSAQGWLVECGADRVRILKVNGRHTTIGIESLSAEDRAYVASVEERLVAEPHGAASAPTETAGL